MSAITVEDGGDPPVLLYTEAGLAPVFSLLTATTLKPGPLYRPVKQYTDLRFAIETAGGRIHQNPLVEPDYNITLVFLSEDHTMNEMKMDQLRVTLANDERRIYKDFFHENYIWDMVRSHVMPDLNLYRIGKSLFQEYDANSILSGKLKWSDLKFRQDDRISQNDPRFPETRIAPARGGKKSHSSSDDDAQSESSSKSSGSKFFSVDTSPAHSKEVMDNSAETRPLESPLSEPIREGVISNIQMEKDGKGHNEEGDHRRKPSGTHQAHKSSPAASYAKSFASNSPLKSSITTNSKTFLPATKSVSIPSSSAPQHPSTPPPSAKKQPSIPPSSAKKLSSISSTSAKKDPSIPSISATNPASIPSPSAAKPVANPTAGMPVATNLHVATPENQILGAEEPLSTPSKAGRRFFRFGRHKESAVAVGVPEKDNTKPTEEQEITRKGFFKKPALVSISKPSDHKLSVPMRNPASVTVPASPSPAKTPIDSKRKSNTKTDSESKEKEALTKRWVSEASSRLVESGEPAGSDFEIYSESEDEVQHRSVSMSPVSSPKKRKTVQPEVVVKSPKQNSEQDRRAPVQASRTTHGRSTAVQPDRLQDGPGSSRQITREVASSSRQTTHDHEPSSRTVNVVQKNWEVVVPVSAFSDDSDDDHRASTSRASSTQRSRYGGPKLFFTQQEKQKMLDWVCKRGDHDRIMSQDLYIEMEEAKICPGRTHHSLSNSFRKYIVTRLDTFKIGEKDKKLLHRRLSRK